MLPIIILRSSHFWRFQAINMHIACHIDWWSSNDKNVLVIVQEKKGWGFQPPISIICYLKSFSFFSTLSQAGTECQTEEVCA